MTTHEEWQALERQLPGDIDEWSLHPPVRSWYQEYFLGSCLPASPLAGRNDSTYPCDDPCMYPSNVLDGVLQTFEMKTYGWEGHK